jgi:hypothetical protein
MPSALTTRTALACPARIGAGRMAAWTALEPCSNRLQSRRLRGVAGGSFDRLVARPQRAQDAGAIAGCGHPFDHRPKRMIVPAASTRDGQIFKSTPDRGCSPARHQAKSSARRLSIARRHLSEPAKRQSPPRGSQKGRQPMCWKSSWRAKQPHGLRSRASGCLRAKISAQLPQRR